MAGGPPARKQNSELRRMNIDVTGGVCRRVQFWREIPFKETLQVVPLTLDLQPEKEQVLSCPENKVVLASA
ncbi:hypothetical protein PHYPO_G00245230 [Pangasianodon hypophthalmus]|uniref:Uncharacterized protein n=1 Tax=Pangasianodon hypophthalmus TaxID=310915 RepID=A0A5N5NG64_PANHP|nr:hypothetical protein PHYPO_G00245230 [Pangasianodon hypophthalmus]